MPAWASDLLNLGFAIFFGVMVILMIREGLRTYWPHHLDKIKAQTKKAEADAELADALKVANVQQAGCLERLCDMGDHIVRHVDMIPAMHQSIGYLQQDVEGVRSHLGLQPPQRRSVAVQVTETVDAAGKHHTETAAVVVQQTDEPKGSP